MRPEKTAIAGITGGLLTPVGMSTGLLGNVSLGAINGVANTTFQDLYYNAGSPTGSSMLWSTGSGFSFGGLGYLAGYGTNKFISSLIPVYGGGVAALLQKPNNTSQIWSNGFGGGVQGVGGLFRLLLITKGALNV